MNKIYFVEVVPWYEPAYDHPACVTLDYQKAKEIFDRLKPRIRVHEDVIFYSYILDDSESGYIIEVHDFKPGSKP